MPEKKSAFECCGMPQSSPVGSTLRSWKEYELPPPLCPTTGVLCPDRGGGCWTQGCDQKKASSDAGDGVVGQGAPKKSRQVPQKAQFLLPAHHAENSRRFWQIFTQKVPKKRTNCHCDQFLAALCRAQKFGQISEKAPSDGGVAVGQRGSLTWRGGL